MSDVTRILKSIEEGDSNAARRLLPLVYNELRSLAAQKLSREAAGQTLQPTALVHEAYLRLVGTGDERPWDSRAHFYAAAAEAMRRILIDEARKKQALRHGGNLERRELDEAELAGPEATDDVLALDEALEKLNQRDSTKADLVKLRYFAGLTIEQAANMLGISTSTADRYWVYARAWLHREITNGTDPPGNENP